MDRKSKQRIVKLLRDRMPTIESSESCRMSHKVEGMIESSEEIRAYAGLHIVIPTHTKLDPLLDFLSLVCFVQARQPEQILKARIWCLSDNQWITKGVIGFQPETAVVGGAAKRLLKALFQAPELKDKEGKPKVYRTAPNKGLMDHGDLVVSLGTCSLIYRQLRKQGWPKQYLNIWELEPIDDEFIRIRLNGVVLMDAELD